MCDFGVIFVPSVFENNVNSMLYNFNWDTHMNGSIQIFCATFCFFCCCYLNSQFLTEVHKNLPSKTVNLSISPFSSVQFYVFAYL